jgi:hypothetical protein
MDGDTDQHYEGTQIINSTNDHHRTSQNNWDGSQEHNRGVT